MKASDIIKRYEAWHPERGIDELLEMRQQLSISCTKIANEVRKLKSEVKQLEVDRRVSEAETKLTADGTGVIKEAKAIRDNAELRKREAIADGQARGYEILLDSYYKVLDSMASYIKTMQTI